MVSRSRLTDDGNKLKVGKGVAFVKSQLRRLRQEDETWEVDFRAFPKKKGTGHVGLAVTQPHGDLLAVTEIEKSPTVNDLATLLANAMKRPLALEQHRPRCIHLRANSKWKSLFPALKELGIEVAVQCNLRKVNEAFGDYLNSVVDVVRRVGKTKPTEEQAEVETAFPAIARWVKSYGHIEIGDHEGFGFVVRALDYGGLIFEDDKSNTLAEAMVALEKGLAEYFERES